MSEINVLVSGNVTPKGKGGSILKEENSGTDRVAMEFAAIFGGWLAQAMGQGQDSGLQSSDPAGKEANSGQTGIQGLEGMLGTLRTVAGLNWGSTSGQEQPATLLSQENLFGDVADSGIGSGQLQTGKLPLSELDQYRVLITQLLQDMSGEISNVSVKPAEIQGLLTQLSQGMNLNTSTANVDQSNSGQLLQNLSTQNTPQVQTQSQSINPQSESMGWTVSQEQVVSVAQSMKSNDIQSGLQNKASEQVTNTVRNENLSNTLTGLQGTLSEPTMESSFNPTSGKTAAQTMSLNRNLTQTLNSPQDMLLDQTQNGGQPDEIRTETHLLKMNVQTETGQNGAGKEKQNLSGNGNILNSTDAGTEGANSNAGNFSHTNLTLNSAAEVGNKTAVSPNLPIWQQVAQELQAKVLNQLPTVRELNIQLHPAELGQISISVTLDNGQVHLTMHASEVATGQILQNNFPQLRESLSQSGVQCGLMQMGFTDSNPNFNQGRNQTFTSLNKNQDEQDSDGFYKDEEQEAVSALSASNQEIGQSYRINVTA